MPKALFFAYFVSIFFAAVAGIAKWGAVARGVRYLVFLMIVTLVTEGFSYALFITHRYDARSAIYHLFNPLQGMLFSAFLLSIMGVTLTKIRLLSIVTAWIMVAALNVLFFQKVRSFNSNVLIVESVLFIAASLYCIYDLLRTGDDMNLLRQPNVRLVFVTLTLWSATFFFWPAINILFKMHWKHVGTVMSTQLLFNFVIYLSFGFTFLTYPSKTKF